MLKEMSEKGKYLHLKFHGSITQQDIKRVQLQYGETVLQKHIIFDLTNTELHLTTLNEIQQLVEMIKPISVKRSGLKAALVGYFDEELLFLKTLKTVAEHKNIENQIKVFSYLCEAEEWMNS